jgi:hypothetical protein
MAAPRAADSLSWEQGCLVGAGKRHEPVLRLAGRGRSWLVTENGQLYRDGLFALAAGPAGQAAARGSDFGAFSGDLDETLHWLALRTSAHLLLDELAAAAQNRPVAAEADITRCERRIGHPIWQYVTGRGAQRRVVNPWEAWTATYADRLANLRSAWDTEVRARLAALPAEHPLKTLIAPLALVHVERDTTDILREYRVLVAYGDRIGFAATLREALNQVFGAGAGDATTTPAQQAPPPAPGAAPLPPADAGPAGTMSPEMRQAVTDIADSIERLQQARAGGDFAAEGQALADLDAASQRFESAQAAAGSGAPESPAPPAPEGGG